MKIIGLALISALLIFASCDRDEEDVVAPECDTFTTVRDLRGLDGCRFVFELADGQRLVPMIIDCIILEKGKEVEPDPLAFFEYVDGKQVKIAYELQPDYGSLCMVGDVVKITCITEVALEASH